METCQFCHRQYKKKDGHGCPATQEGNRKSDNPTVYDNGPAFPMGLSSIYGQAGMSLRDYFAAHADFPLENVILTLREKGIENPKVGEVVKCRSEMKYAEADAMLKEREK